MNSKNFILCQVPAYSGPIEMVDSLGTHEFVKFIGVFSLWVPFPLSSLHMSWKEILGAESK